MKYIILGLSLLVTLCAQAQQFPYVISPTNSPVNAYTLQRTGPYNKWVPFPVGFGGVTNVTTTNTSLGITNLINSLATNVVNNAQVWTNDGRWYTPVGNTNSIFIRTNDGSLFLGNATRDWFDLTGITGNALATTTNDLTFFPLAAMAHSSIGGGVKSNYTQWNSEIGLMLSDSGQKSTLNTFGTYNTNTSEIFTRFEVHSDGPNNNSYLRVNIGNLSGANQADLILRSPGNQGITLSAVNGSPSTISIGGAFSATDNSSLTLNGVEYLWPDTNLLANQVFASDGGTPQQIYGVTLVPGITGGTTNFATTNTSTGLTNAIVSVVNNNFGYVTNVVTTNTSTGVTNFVNSQVTNQIPNFIHGTTNYLAKFTPNSNEVGNSIVFEAATNQWEWRSRPSGTAYTNSITNRIFGQYTSEANFMALELVSGYGSSPPVTSSQFHLLHGKQGSSSTSLIQPLQIMDAWQFNSGLNTPGGITAGYISPLSDNLYAIGSTSARVLALTTGPNGLIMTENTSAPNIGAIGANAFGMSVNTANILFWRTTGGSPSAVGQYGSQGGLLGFDLGGGGFIGGGGSLGTSVAFLTPLGTGRWQWGTNASSSPIGYSIEGELATGADHNGGNVAYTGGKGTGTGRGGNFSIATSPKATVSASSANAFRTNLFIAANPVTLTTNSATSICTITLPTSLTTLGCKVDATTEITDGVDMAYVAESFSFGAINKGGVVTTKVGAVAQTVGDATGSAGVSTVWTATVSGTTITLKNNASTTGISSTNALTRWRLQLDSGSVCIITAQ